MFLDDDDKKLGKIVEFDNTEDEADGRRKNSKGEYIDENGAFPGFGSKKAKQVPNDCFPNKCYET